MTMIGMASRPSDGADPRRTQKRVASSGSGRTVAVDITGDDRLRLINQLPSRWPEVIKARERGETLEQIARWAKVPTPCQPSCRLRKVAVKSDGTWADAPDGVEDLVMEQVHDGPACLRYLMAYVYAELETKLHDIAQARARLMI